MTLEITLARNCTQRRRLPAVSAMARRNLRRFTDLIANLGAVTSLVIVTNPANAKRASVNES